MFSFSEKLDRLANRSIYPWLRGPAIDVDKKPIYFAGQIYPAHLKHRLHGPNLKRVGCIPIPIS